MVVTEIGKFEVEDEGIHTEGEKFADDAGDPDPSVAEHERNGHDAEKTEEYVAHQRDRHRRPDLVHSRQHPGNDHTSGKERQRKVLHGQPEVRERIKDFGIVIRVDENENERPAHE